MKSKKAIVFGKKYSSTKSNDDDDDDFDMNMDQENAVDLEELTKKLDAVNLNKEKNNGKQNKTV